MMELAPASTSRRQVALWMPTRSAQWFSQHGWVGGAALNRGHLLWPRVRRYFLFRVAVLSVAAFVYSLLLGAM